MASGVISIETQRQSMAQGEAEGLKLLGPCPSHLSEAWIDILLPGGRTNRTRVVWPKPAEGDRRTCSLIVYFHGGGFAVCSPDLVLAPARGFSSLFSSVVACPSLNQFPEQPFPAPTQIAWETCAWLSDVNNLNKGLLKGTGAEIDLKRGFVVGGLSAGGTAAAVIAGIAGAASAEVRDFTGISPLHGQITGVFTGIPMLVTDAMLPARYKDDLRSIEEQAEEEPQVVALLRDLEQRLGDAVHTPWFSPINLDLSNPKTTQDHPRKVFIYAGALDALRDEAIIYKKWLSELPGVEARIRVLEGQKHTAWTSLPGPDNHNPKMKEMTLDGMAWLLGLEWDKSQLDTLI
ncbi:alpha/beta-hydrolase [Annulohypoxylon truncatum]|uniref:alpha/beta-hydrolase n=1 Tax=Annulohypoxylon truncatum TaxID=327061 RepID=UPI0020074EAA|nr:alpha/beta-hydrolase [Annulohypoxylon truncatum]KAI1212030.1 alpha/beta-hydrolase [Annulohypoxylon truncatum]